MATTTLVILCALFFSAHAAGLTESCTTNDQCTTENAQCVNSVCSCIDTYIPNGVGDTCLLVPTSWPGVCSEDVQCTTVFYGDVTCVEKKCACAANQHFLDGICWRTHALGDKCLNSNECYEEEYPDRVICGDDGVCVCRSGYEEGEGTNANKCVNSASQNGVGLVVLLSALFAASTRLI